MKKIVSVILATVILLSVLILPISAANITDDDIEHFAANIQKIKDYIIENGKALDNYLYLEDTQTDTKMSKMAKIMYYPKTDEIKLDYTVLVLIPGIKDISSVSLDVVSFEQQSHFEFVQLMDKYLSTAHSANFNWIDFDINHVPSLYLDLINNAPGGSASEQQKRVTADYFFEMQTDAVNRWDDMLKELFGFRYEGIGLGASLDKHMLSKTGYCVLCGRRFFDPSNCSCTCHRDGFFFETITVIKTIFWKLFRIKQTCDCGMRHY